MIGNKHIKVGHILKIKQEYENFKPTKYHGKKLKCIGFNYCTGCPDCQGLVILEDSSNNVYSECATSNGDFFFDIVNRSWKDRLK